MLITRILNKLGRIYSDILNFITTQSEFIPRWVGLVRCNLKAEMLKKPYLCVQFSWLFQWIVYRTVLQAEYSSNIGLPFYRFL